MGGGLAQRAPGGRGLAGRRSALRSTAALCALALVAALWLPGCASKPSAGFYHSVRAGENLYRIGLRYGVHHSVLRRVNKIPDETRLRVGTRLWIPQSNSKRGRASREAQLAQARSDAQRQATREARLHFKWPLRGRLTSRFGTRKGRPHEGIDVAAPRGSSVRAAEAGKVIHAGRLGAYGRCVIVKHAGHYRSVYAHATKTLVRKGEFVDRGSGSRQWGQRAGPPVRTYTSRSAGARPRATPCYIFPDPRAVAVAAFRKGPQS